MAPVSSWSVFEGACLGFRVDGACLGFREIASLMELVSSKLQVAAMTSPCTCVATPPAEFLFQQTQQQRFLNNNVSSAGKALAACLGPRRVGGFKIGA